MSGIGASDVRLAVVVVCRYATYISRSISMLAIYNPPKSSTLSLGTESSKGIKQLINQGLLNH